MAAPPLGGGSNSNTPHGVNPGTDSSQSSSSSRSSEEWISLAQLARNAFRSHNYQVSLEHLNKMAKLRPDDLKVAHNIMIVQHHQHGCGEPAKLLEQLLRLKQRMDESATREDEEGALAVELSTVLIRYNQALLSFSMKQYGDALAILEPLFRNIDPLEFVAIKVAYLLLEAYLVTRQTEKALQVISFIEKTYLRPPSPPAQHAATEQVSTLLGQAGDEEGADSSSTSTTTNPSSSSSASPTTSALATALPHIAVPRVVGPPPSITSVGELKASLHINRARVHLLARAFPAAKRELKQATSLVAQSSPLLVCCMFLKAQVEFARANFRKAVKLLNVIHQLHPSSSSPSDASLLTASDRTLRALYYADIGAIHFKLKKYRAAAHYLVTALKEQQHMTSTTTVMTTTSPRLSVPFAKREEILYNLGLCYLQLREGELAFACLHEALNGIARTPRRCVRLAEAAVMAHSSRTRLDSLQVEIQQFSSTLRRVAVLLPSSSLSSSSSSSSSSSPSSTSSPSSPSSTTFTSTSPSSPSDEQSSVISPVPSIESMLESSIRFLTCALLILSAPRPAAPAAATSPSTTAATTPFAPTPSVASVPLKDAADAPLIRICALANLAYCHLSLGNSAAALSASLTLLALPDLAASHSFVAHLYAAEALCSLNRISEALTHLSPSLVETHPSFASIDPTSVTNYRVQFYTALAVVHSLEEDFERAHACVNNALALLQGAPPTQLLLLHVYVELRRGNTDEALTALRRGRCRVIVRTVPPRHQSPPKNEKR